MKQSGLRITLLTRQTQVLCQCRLYYEGRGAPPNEAEALRWFQRGAAAGDPAAMNALGLIYNRGKVVQQDYGVSFDWFNKAAALGNTDAMQNLGVVYAKGIGRSPTCAEGMRWLRKSADLGNTVGMNVLGLYYDDGTCVQANKAEALRWYRKSAALGNDDAKSNINSLNPPQIVEEDAITHISCDGRGRGGPLSMGEAMALGRLSAQRGQDAIAFQCFSFAAEQGNASAQNDVAYAYEHGIGVPSDLKKAFDSYERAAKQHNSWGLSNLKRDRDISGAGEGIEIWTLIWSSPENCPCNPA